MTPKFDDQRCFIIKPASTTFGALRVVRGLDQNDADDPMIMQVLVANIDESVQMAGGLIATAYECDYETPCNEDDLKYYHV